MCGSPPASAPRVHALWFIENVSVLVTDPLHATSSSRSAPLWPWLHRFRSGLRLRGGTGTEVAPLGQRRVALCADRCQRPQYERKLKQAPTSACSDRT